MYSTLWYYRLFSLSLTPPPPPNILVYTYLAAFEEKFPQGF